MSNLRDLLSKANRKHEMRWKVLVFDPKKDNELVDEFKDFECIDCATAKKRELLEKHPDKTIEIIAEAIAKARIDIGNDDIDDAYMDVNYAISRDTNYKLKDFKKESAQKNEALNLDKLTDADAKQLIMYLNDFIKDKASKYYYIDKIEAILKKRYKAESSQKNESYTVQNVKTREDAEKIIKDKCKPKDFHFTDAGIAYDGKKNIAQYTPHSNQLVIFESAQINETRGYKVIVELGVPDNMNNRDIEDEVERLLRSSRKIDVVIDVTAERS